MKNVRNSLLISITLGISLLMAGCGDDFTSSDEGSGNRAITPAKISIPAANVTASTYDTAGGWTPAKAVDGDLATRWAGDGDGAYITFNLGSSLTVGYVKIAFYNGSTRTFTFDVQTSTNGTTFTNVLTGKTNAANNNLQTFDFTDVIATHVRIVGHKNTANTWNSYNEVEVWGAATPVATASPVVTTPPTAAPTSSAVTGILRTVNVSSASSLMSALKNALPGDRIVVAAGTYTGSTSSSGNSNAYFYSGVNGTATNPIIVESANASSKAVMSGSSTGSGYVLYITGNYWQVKNVKITKAKKGIMFDNANNTYLYGVDVYNIGKEGIHYRDGSSNSLAEYCTVSDTGNVTADYGEGFYVGSDVGKWGTYIKECDNITIRNCTIGPNTRAECIDVKEGTTNTIVEYCTMNGTGISGANSADSFMDVKGNNGIYRYNTLNRNGNTIIVDAFQVQERSTGWGYNNDFNHNTCYIDSISGYIVNVKAGSARVSANTRSPSGNMYTGDYTTY